VLFAVLALLKAAAYRLDGFELLYSTRGAIFGASYTDVHVRRPALSTLVLISLAAAVVLLYNLRRRGWTLPLVAGGTWLVASIVMGGIIPAAIERFTVIPNQLNLESEYIQNHVDFTRDGYGMGPDKVVQRDFPASNDLTAADIAANRPTIDNVRLWDPVVLQPAYDQLQAIRPYYNIANVDVDRYVIDGELTQVMVAARELDSSQLPATGWLNETLLYTHGFGQVLSRANDVNPTTGEPSFLVRDVPPEASVPELKISQPQIYFGETALTNSYVIVATKQEEVEVPSNHYAGSGGVRLSNIFVEAAMALRFGDLNMLISPELTDQSRILMVRNVVDRLERVAPFLIADEDPYLAIIGGRSVWIVDLYSVTDRYPYALPVLDHRISTQSKLPRDFNYIRNSVKAVVDAENGSMDIYVLEDADPLTLAYQQLFPGVFTDASEITAELRGHFRYPEDMFRVQSDIYSTYHQTDPREFFPNNDLWEIPVDRWSADRQQVYGDQPAAGSSSINRDKRHELPYYLLIRLPGEEELSYLAFQSFNPANRDNMTAFLVARSGPDNYGELIEFTLPRGQLVNGIQQVSTRIDQDPAISEQFTLLGQQGSSVIRGNMLIVPIEESLLFVQPIYLQGDGVELPEYKRVVVVYGEDTLPIMRETLDGALAEIFGTAVDEPIETTDPTTPSTDPDQPTEASDDVSSLVIQIDSLLMEANDALATGDLGGYQTKVNEAALVTERLRALIESVEG
jgi:hypothetical protein